MASAAAASAAHKYKQQTAAQNRNKSAHRNSKSLCVSSKEINQHVFSSFAKFICASMAASAKSSIIFLHQAAAPA
jgi:hypothetical protein